MVVAAASFAITTFTIMLGASLGAQIGISVLTQASYGFRNIFSTFITITIVFSLLLSIITFTNLTATIMDNRAKDIAVLKASGGSIDKLYSHFMTQSIQAVFLIAGLSMLVAIAGYSAGLLFINLLTGLNIQLEVPALELLGVFGFLVIFSVIFGHRSVVSAVRHSVIDTLSPQVQDITLLRSQGWFASKTTKPGSTFRVAFRNTRRTRRFALRLETCIFISMILTTSITVGGILANQTSVNYINRALNDQLVFVGNSQMWIQYSSLVGFEPSPSYNSSFKYLNSQYEINDSVVNQIAALPGVLGVDPRITLETQLSELKEVVITNTENQSGSTSTYTTVGDDRHANVLVSGIEPNEVVSDWLISGRLVNSSDYPLSSGGYSAVTIGDSVQTIFDDTSVEKAGLFGTQFVIVGTVLDDPVDSGWTVYMLHNVLGSLLNYNGSNMVLVKCDSSTYSETLRQINDTVSRYGFSAFRMGSVVDHLINYVNFAWLSAFVPVILLLLTLVMDVLSYMNLAFEKSKRDFGIMRTVGAPPSLIRRTMLRQGVIISTWPGISGIIAGLTLSYWLLLPGVAVSLFSILVSIGLCLLLFSASILSSFISARASRKRIIEIIA
jgi:ABC-type antimicrobial peptide transport system permease subunit